LKLRNNIYNKKIISI